MKIKDVLKHVSFSTLTMLVDRPDKFLRQKVFGIKETPSLSMIVGSALHAAAQAAIENGSVDMEAFAKDAFEAEIQKYGTIDDIVKDEPVEKYKKALTEIEKACRNFLSALPQIDTGSAGLETEKKYESSESEFGLPNVGIVDVRAGDIIIDWKFTKSLTKEEDRKPRYEQQAYYYRDLLASQGIVITKALFVEVKRAESKGGAPNHFAYEVVFDDESSAAKLYKYFKKEAKRSLESDIESLLGRTTGTRSFLGDDAQKAAAALEEEEKLMEAFLANGAQVKETAIESEDEFDF